MKCPCLALLVVIQLGLPGALAQDRDGREPLRSWTVDDVVNQERTSGWALSRDGTRALWIRQRPDKKKDKHLPTLMLTDLRSNQHRELTIGQDGISAPAFSPDGQQVAFLSDRSMPAGVKGPEKEEKGDQLWLLDLRGGEARPLTTLPFGVSRFQWHDEDTLFLSVRERRTRPEAIAAEDKDDTIVVEDDERFLDASRRLFRFEIEARKLTRVTSNDERLGRFEVSPDGRFLLALLDRSPSYRAEGSLPPRFVLIDLATGEQTELLAERKNKPLRFHWRHDSSGFYLVCPRSSVDGETWGAIDVLEEASLADLVIRDVELNHPAGLRQPLAVLADGFLTALCNGVRPELARYVRDGDGYTRQTLEGVHAGRIFTFSMSRDADRVIYVTGSASDPDHVFSARLEGARLKDEKEIYRPNEGFANRPIARTEVTRWVGALDEEVEGIVYFPADYQEGRRYPLVLITHGGPHGVDPDRFTERWSNTPNLYAQRGAFVLKTNYHGSSDYGLEFGESIKGRYYELELVDMFAGIQALIDRGLVDPDRMGLVGWSNGAILSMAALTLNDRFAPGYDFRFRACAPGAGDVNWTSDFGNCAFGASFDEFYLGGTPWSDPETYLSKSPLFHVEKVTTPTIIFFGTDDTSVPTEQGWEWYRALHRVGKAPVRFLLFPGQPHGLGKLTHQRRKLTEELAWFDRYLFESGDGEELLVKEGSPLDLARRRDQIARHEGRVGVEQNGILVPETIPFGEIEVGRFEVTRAQWSAYAAGFESGSHPDHPMTGITAEQATGYAAWLGELTGAGWRLPTAGEFERLEKHEGSRENDLDHWAGYAPAPVDAVRLSAMVVDLPLEIALEAVGSRPPALVDTPAGKQMLFDVRGNAAEWVQGPQGLEVRGACAATSPDDRGELIPAPPSLVGLRLVRQPERRD